LTALTLHVGYSDAETFPYQMDNGARIANFAGAAINVIRQAADDIGVDVIDCRTSGY
jgi:hypothetical protein